MNEDDVTLIAQELNRVAHWSCGDMETCMRQVVLVSEAMANAGYAVVRMVNRADTS